MVGAAKISIRRDRRAVRVAVDGGRREPKIRQAVDRRKRPQVDPVCRGVVEISDGGNAIAGLVDEDIRASTAGERIVAATTVENVVAALALQRVVEGITGDGVVELGAAYARDASDDIIAAS